MIKSSVFIGGAFANSENSDELEAVRASHEFTASRWLTCVTSNHTVNNGVSGACTSEASGAACAHRARLIHRAAGSERTSTRARPRVSARDCVDAIDTHAMGVVRCAPPSSREATRSFPSLPLPKRRFSLSTRPCWPRYVAAHPRAPRVRLRPRVSDRGDARHAADGGFFPTIASHPRRLAFFPSSGWHSSLSRATLRITRSRLTLLEKIVES